MCGICGIIRFDNKKAEETSLRKMMARMKYRGPDDEGIFLDNSIGLGFVRLSILDLTEAGHQPMNDETGRYTIVFNGEIYNYIELREELKKEGITFKTNSDTEVLLKSYIHYGESCLDKLNGMFAFVIYDKMTGDIIAVRDRFGVKPFYYYKDDNTFIFASEIPPILEVYEKKNEANEQMIFDYLVFNRTDHIEDTFFKSIKKLQHGHVISIKNNKFEIKKWYDLRSNIKNIEADVDTYRQLLIDAVKLRLRSDVPVGVCLSGGLDSSSITSIISSILGNRQINTFSAIYESGQKGDESKFINIYRDELPNMYYTNPNSDGLYEDLTDYVRLHAEPIPATGPYAQYNVMRLAKEHVTVTLDGQGADEQLGGYHYFYGFYLKDLLKSFKLKKFFHESLAYYKVHHSLYGLKTFVYFLLPKRLKTTARVREQNYLTKDFVEKSLLWESSTIVEDLYSSKILKEALLNHFDYKLEHLLKWNDRNSMAFSVESRTPFLDYRLVEYTLSLSSDNIIKNGYTKSILRESLKNILPEEIRLRKDKIGFGTPQDEWFRTEIFQNLIWKLLRSEKFKDRNIVDVNIVIDLYSKHLEKQVDASKEIWKWIHLELWFREFIDNKK
jgi:asparagine synthase (glutamine-hydrolysing)